MPNFNRKNKKSQSLKSKIRSYNRILNKKVILLINLINFQDISDEQKNYILNLINEINEKINDKNEEKLEKNINIKTKKVFYYFIIFIIV